MSHLKVMPMLFPGEPEAGMTRVCTGTIMCAGKSSGGLVTSLSYQVKWR